MKKNIFLNKQILRVMGFLITLAISTIVIPCDCMNVNATSAELHKLQKVASPCHATSDASSNHKNQNKKSNSTEHENCCCTDSNLTYTSKIYVEADGIKPTPRKLPSAIFYSYVSHKQEILENIQYTRGSPPTFSIFNYSVNTFLALLQRFLI